MRTWNRAISAWSPPRPWRPSCCANGAASPARPQILGDLFDRLGLRRIRAARFGQQPDGLRLELRRVSRSFCHGSIISHRVRGNAEQKSVHITPDDEHSAINFFSTGLKYTDQVTLNFLSQLKPDQQAHYSHFLWRSSFWHLFKRRSRSRRFSPAS